METTRVTDAEMPADQLARLLETASKGGKTGNITRKLTPAQVEGILAAHGWPGDPEGFAAQVAALRKLGELEVCFEYAYTHTVKTECEQCGREFGSENGLAKHKGHTHAKVPA